MLNKSKNVNDDFVKQISKIFGVPELNKIKNGIEKALKNKNKSNMITSLLNKYSINKLDSKACNQLIYDIISKLINLKVDFKLFMEIYMLTIDEMKSDILINHFVLNEKKLRKSENGDKIDFGPIEFGIDLSCMYDENSYYKTFIRGILNYFILAFKENYLFEYFEKQEYLKFLNEYNLYKDNKSSLEKSLNNMLIDMLRIIAEQSNKDIDKDKDNNNESKISKSKYGIFLIKAKLQKENKVIKIYDSNSNDDGILKAIDKLLEDNEIQNDEELYSKLLFFRDDICSYIQQGIRDDDLKNLNNQVSLNNSLIYKIEKENQDLKNENNNLNKLVKELKKDIGGLKSTVNNITSQMTYLKGKVEFMEPIVISLICRKAINHSIIKILEKYKSKIKITKIVANNEFKYKIEFIDSVNNISIDNLNEFIDSIFAKKDIFNQDSHLINKTIPNHINDLWGQIKKNLKLNQNEQIIFDSLITTDIKSCFNFGGEDLLVTNYLKNVDIKEFGK